MADNSDNSGGHTHWERTEMPLVGPPLEGGIRQPLHPAQPCGLPPGSEQSQSCCRQVQGRGARGRYVRGTALVITAWHDRKAQGPSSFCLYMFSGRHHHHSLSNTSLEILKGFLYINVFKAHLLLSLDPPLSELLLSDAHTVFWIKTEIAWWNFLLKGKLLHVYISYFSLP